MAGIMSFPAPRVRRMMSPQAAAELRADRVAPASPMSDHPSAEPLPADAQSSANDKEWNPYQTPQSGISDIVSPPRRSPLWWAYFCYLVASVAIGIGPFLRIVLQELVTRLDLRAASPQPERFVRRAITNAPRRGGEVVAERRESIDAAPVAAAA